MAARPRKLSAWLLVVINQLAFPGLGTVLSGRRIGYVQAALMVVGFLITVAVMGWLVVCSVRFFGHPEWSEEDYRAQYIPYLWWLRWGLGLCAVAWCWAGWSSVLIWRNRNKN
jgi:hypothetical protein